VVATDGRRFRREVVGLSRGNCDCGVGADAGAAGPMDKRSARGPANDFSRLGRDDRRELRVNNDGTIVALSADVIGDAGAYSVYPWTAVIEPIQAVSFMPGPYRVPNYRARARAVATNKAPTGPYRGVGRPPAVFAMEGLIDRAARRLGIDPVELRMRNFVRAEEFPYKTATGIVWDRAGFIECMQKACEALDYAAARADQERARLAGRLVGIGFGSYVELTGIGSATPAAPGMPVPAGTEAATIRVDPSGSVTAIFGVASHGQGLETALAQVVADEFEVPLEDVRVRFGDTAFAPYGTGSYASRGAVLGGGAAILAARAIRAKARRIAAHLLETEPAALDAGGGELWARGGTGRRITLRDIAQAAYAGAKRLPRGMEPGLEATLFYDPYYGTATPATHAVMLEVDRETWAVRILRYVRRPRPCDQSAHSRRTNRRRSCAGTGWRTARRDRLQRGRPATDRHADGLSGAVGSRDAQRGDVSSGSFLAGHTGRFSRRWRIGNDRSAGRDRQCDRGCARASRHRARRTTAHAGADFPVVLARLRAWLSVRLIRASTQIRDWEPQDRDKSFVREKSLISL
jgi:Molybdopterin-binding domain of aldehyde dehydrogenase